MNEARGQAVSFAQERDFLFQAEDGIRDAQESRGLGVVYKGQAQARVYEWRQQHPEGRKADCHRETGLDPKTVRKWWDCPPPAVRFENGHITVRVSPSQELSDWLLDALHDGGQE